MKDDQSNKKCCLPEDHVTIGEEGGEEIEQTTPEPDNGDGKNNGNGNNGNGDEDDKDGSVSLYYQNYIIAFQCSARTREIRRPGSLTALNWPSTATTRYIISPFTIW